MRDVVALWTTWFTALLVACATCAADDAHAPRIGVLWTEKSLMAEAVSEGFLKGMEHGAPEVDIEVRGGLDIAEAAMLYDQWQEEKDAVVFLRSTGAKFMASRRSDRPMFFGGCTNPIELGIVDNMDRPGLGATGVTYYLPLRKQLDVFHLLAPEAKRIALVTEEGHPAAELQRSETREWCEMHDLEYVDCVGTTAPDILEKVKGIQDDVDILVLSANAAVEIAARGMDDVVHKPIFAYNEQPVLENHAICGVVAEDRKLGGMLAESVIDVVIHGKDVSDVPVKTDPRPAFVVSMEAAGRHGVTIPPEFLKRAKFAR